MAAGSKASSTERNILRAELLWSRPGLLKFTYEANGFLRRMVRNLTGTIVDVGRGKWTAGDFERIIESGDRKQAGMTAPGHGLYLISVNYQQSAK